MHVHVSFLLFQLLCSVTSLGVAPEPWPVLEGLGYVFPPQPSSPDPLVSYGFPAGVNTSVLQIFELPPVAMASYPPSAFVNASAPSGSTLVFITVEGNHSGSPRPGGSLLVIDFGVESPGWLEFDSPDLPDSALPTLTMGSSEYTQVDFVAGYKSGPPKVYCSSTPSPSLCTYRLETNEELYEGLRYGFIALAPPASPPPPTPLPPWHITAIRAVVQTKAVNYSGSFHSAGDPMLECLWYTGAYTVRAALQSDYMGSILEDRGDRESWTGDAHTTQMTSMVAFHNYPFVLSNLNRTSTTCQGIATYCLYFVLSVLDYWRETGEDAALLYFLPNMVGKLEAAHALFPAPLGLRFVGHDDRLGSGFANNTTPETQALYRFLAMRCWREVSLAVGALGVNASLAAHLMGYFTAAEGEVRRGGGGKGVWWASLGVHSAGDALNAGFVVDAGEQAGIAASALSSLVTLPSQSNFNQYFLLQALATLGMIDRAVESARVVWGFQLGMGATTFWEQSHPDWATFLPPGPPPLPNHEGWVSLCHPWSSGITPWLTKWVLGIRPLTPGYGAVLLAPHVTEGQGVGGRVTTPLGVVDLAVSGVVGGGGGISINVTLPKGCTGTLQLSLVLLRRLGLMVGEEAGEEAVRVTVLPTLNTQAEGILLPFTLPRTPPLDTPLVDERTEELGGPQGATPRLRSRAIIGALSGGGTWRLRVTTTSATTSTSHSPVYTTPFPPPSWPSRLVAYDTTTQGNWLGVYGTLGYTLLGFAGGGSNGTLQSLPPWVQSVVVQGPSGGGGGGFQGRVFSWQAPSTGNGTVRAELLQHPTTPGLRGLGAAAPFGTGSFPTDIAVDPTTAPSKYRLAAYFCDYGPTPWGDGQSGGRRQSVYLLKGYPSLDPAAPRTGIQGFQGGVWLVWEVEGSVRLRVSTIRGDYGVLSALAFDSI